MFKVYKSVIDTLLIDQVLSAHEQFKYGKLSYFRAQGTLGFDIRDCSGIGTWKYKS